MRHPHILSFSILGAYRISFLQFWSCGDPMTEPGPPQHPKTLFPSNVHDVHDRHNCWLCTWARNSWVVSQSRRSSQVGPKPILNSAEEWASGKDYSGVI